MKVSVVVPIYNVSRALLSACLESLAKQTFRADEYEILLVDDCSTNEETLSTVATFAERTRNASLLRHHENKGLNEARRSGVSAARGEYIVFVDGDDILTRDAIENLWLKTADSSADLVTAPCWRWDPVERQTFSSPITGKAFASNYLDRVRDTLASRHSFTMCGRLFRRSLLTPDILHIPVRRYHEDVVTLARIMFRVSSVAHVTRPLYYYTINEGSITNNFGSKHAEDMVYALNEWVKLAEGNNLLSVLSASMATGIEKLLEVCVRRCVQSVTLDMQPKIEILRYLRQSYNGFSMANAEPTMPILRALLALEEDDLTHSPISSLAGLSATVFANEAKQRSRRPYQATQMARALKDRIVFICQVDYQLRNAAEFARELRKRGHPCVILDNSGFASGGLRRLHPQELRIFWRTEYIRIAKPPYGRDWLSAARLVVVFNDFNDDFREALEYRYRLGLSAVCMIEGISDFLRVDFKTPRHLPYRRCDHVFLAGEADRKYFSDREVHLVGLPIVEKLAKKEPTFPARPLAALNVNFTYGVLEDSRGTFIELAQSAFVEAGFDWQITQHPADRGTLNRFPVSKKTQYELIDECTVFVSRFATGILEALASGKPAIYFNPHREKVEKFTEPLGAFEIAVTKEQLVAALRTVLEDIENGVDFRERALPFLEQHTAYERGIASTTRFADSAIGIIDSEGHMHKEAVDTIFNGLGNGYLPSSFDPEGILGDFKRHDRAQLNDEEMIARYFGERDGVMIDVGANLGNSCDVYLGKGWTVHAFEPDPNNRRVLLEIWGTSPLLIVNEEAVSDKAGLVLPFFASAESTGISGLSAFTKGHKKIAEVHTTTLRDYYRKAGIKHANFLKVDVEGFDKFVLDGFPWEVDLPDVVLAEFEDSKTVPLGYTVRDLAATMQRRGYTVFVSEWHPIVRYGITHDWRRLVQYSDHLELKGCWGNLIGFRQPPDRDQLRSIARQTLKFARSPGRKKSKRGGRPAGTPQPALVVGADNGSRVVQPFYAPFGRWLRKLSPRIYTAGKLARRTLAGLWRRRAWTAPVLLLILTIAGLGFLPTFTSVRAFFWIGATFAALAFGLFYLALRVYQLTNVVLKGNADLRNQVQNEAWRVAAVEKKLIKRKSAFERMRAEIQATKAAADNAIEMSTFVYTALRTIEKHIAATTDGLRKERAKDKKRYLQARTQAEGEITMFAAEAEATKKELLEYKDGLTRLRERIISSERQIGEMRFPESPSTLVFFGHHKCASRFFRNEVFRVAAEAADAHVRKYEIKNPPFNYSMGDDLDLCNIDFKDLGRDGRDIVLFSNATARSLYRIQRTAKNWKGIRVIRDPRQVLVSNYLHHKGNHHTRLNGWIWDQLETDKPVLRELPMEEGLLYELDHITKQIIETQILCPFDDPRVMTIKIEDFSKDPKTYLREISGFLGVADIAGIDFNRTSGNPDSGPWQQHFTSRLRHVFKERYGQALIDLGYATDFNW